MLYRRLTVILDQFVWNFCEQTGYPLKYSGNTTTAQTEKLTNPLHWNAMNVVHVDGLGYESIPEKTPDFDTFFAKTLIY
jgi:hypothetical protein